MKRCLAIAILFLSFGVSSEAATCSYYPFKIAVLKARVSRSLLTKGIRHAEIFAEVETPSNKKLTFNPAIKRVLVAEADIDHDGGISYRASTGFYCLHRSIALRYGFERKPLKMWSFRLTKTTVAASWIFSS